MDIRPLHGRHLAGALAVALLVGLVYAPVRHFSYLNFDDGAYVTDNPFVRGGLSLDNVRSAFTRARGGHYHPLTWISHMADVSLFGLSPGPAHLVNVAIHAASAGALFLLVIRCGASAWLAAFIALAFALHPMRLESVAWIAERKDVLSLFFALVTLHAWLGFAARGTALRYAWVVLALAMGLLCKPTLVTLPLLLLLVDAWPLGRMQPGWRRWLEKGPLLALSLASVVTTAVAQRREGAVVDSPGFAFADRVATAAVAYLAYLGKLFWPSGMGIFYPLVKHPPGVGVGAVVALAGLSWLALRDGRTRPALAFAWLWFLVAPLPVIGLVQFGGQAYADRWSYLCHLGLLAGLAVTVRDRLPASLRLAAGAAVVLACAVATSVELPHWRSSEAIFRHTLAVSPDNFMAHTNLGNALDADGRLDEAASHYEEAARLNPTYPEALNNLGTLQARRNQMADAERTFERALAIRPDMLLARYNLGLARHDLGRPVEAAIDWLEVLTVEPHHRLATPSLTFAANRVLLPGCSAGTLVATPGDAERFSRALAAWPAAPEDGALRAALMSVSACLEEQVRQRR